LRGKGGPEAAKVSRAAAARARCGASISLRSGNPTAKAAACSVTLSRRSSMHSCVFHLSLTGIGIARPGSPCRLGEHQPPHAISAYRRPLRDNHPQTIWPSYTRRAAQRRAPD